MTKNNFKKNRILAVALAVMSSALMTAPASASGAGMTTTGYTTQPIGHYEFCKATPAECQPVGRNVPVLELTRENWDDIVRINNQVNTAIAPMTDQEIWGREEVWSYPTTVGDCEDYALLKRFYLIKTGIHPSNLLVTVLKQPNGDGHAILAVRTDRGDFVLDNLVGRIDDWRDTPYTYLKRQSTDHAGRWVTIQDDRKNIARN